MNTDLSNEMKQLIITIIDFIGLGSYFAALMRGMLLQLPFTQTVIIGSSGMVICVISSTCLRLLWKTPKSKKPS